MVSASTFQSTSTHEYHYKGHELYEQLIHAAYYTWFDTLPLPLYILLTTLTMVVIVQSLLFMIINEVLLSCQLVLLTAIFTTCPYKVPKTPNSLQLHDVNNSYMIIQNDNKIAVNQQRNHMYNHS